jgi:hypothetical protein
VPLLVAPRQPVAIGGVSGMTHSLVCCAYFHRCRAGAEPTIAPSAEPTEDPTLAPTSSSFRFVHTGAPRHHVGVFHSSDRAKRVERSR